MTKAKEPKLAADEVKTDSGVVVKRTPGAIPDSAMEQSQVNVDEAEILDNEFLLGWVGELEPGESGYLPSDAEGNVKGPAKRGPIPVGEFGIPVVARVDTTPAPITTPSGAPILKRMNPDEGIDRTPESQKRAT